MRLLSEYPQKSVQIEKSIFSFFLALDMLIIFALYRTKVTAGYLLVFQMLNTHLVLADFIFKIIRSRFSYTDSSYIS